MVGVIRPSQGDIAQTNVPHRLTNVFVVFNTRVFVPSAEEVSIVFCALPCTTCVLVRDPALRLTGTTSTSYFTELLEISSLLVAGTLGSASPAVGPAAKAAALALVPFLRPCLTRKAKDYGHSTPLGSGEGSLGDKCKGGQGGEQTVTSRAILRYRAVLLCDAVRQVCEEHLEVTSALWFASLDDDDRQKGCVEEV